MQQHQRSSQQHASAAAGATQPSKQQQSSQQQQQQHQQQGHHPPATAAATAGGDGGSWGLEQHYDLVGKIGEGTYGVVYLATAKQDRTQMFAIKKFKTGREGDGLSPTAIREILLLRELRHEHIVKLTAVHINRSEPSLSLAFDYAEHDLYEIIWHHRDRLAGPLDPYVVKSLMWQLLNGLSYLHQNWVIHRDLKPSNVLVMGEGPEAGKVKVADFGLARFFQAPLHPLSDNGVVVTIWYRPPELLLGGRHYTRAVDVWGAGCIFAELLTLRPLFQGQERKQPGAPFQLDQCDKIFRVLGHPDPSTWPLLEALPHWAKNTEDIATKRPEWAVNRLEQHLTEVLRQLGDAFANAAGNRGAPGGQVPQMHTLTAAGIDLLQRMLEYDPMKRITAEEALHHPWFHEGPLPGPNAFVTDGKRIVSYPRRHKQAGGAMGTAPAAMQHQQGPQQGQQQQQPSSQQQQQPPRLKGTGSGPLQKQPVRRSSSSSGQQSQQQQQRGSGQHKPSGAARQQQQQQQPRHQQQQQPARQQQQQQRPSGDSKKRKAEGQGRRSDGGSRAGPSSKDHRHR